MGRCVEITQKYKPGCTEPSLTQTTRLEENSHLLKPPINNYCVYNDDFTVMV